LLLIILLLLLCVFITGGLVQQDGCLNFWATSWQSCSFSLWPK